MASWHDITSAAPEFATTVRDCFALRKHMTLATLRRDGSPRISGTEVEFGDDGELYLGCMSGAVKARDLLRNPQFALHSPTIDPPDDDPADWPGEAKVAGTAVDVTGDTDPAAGHRFRLAITEVVHTSVAPSGDRLRIVAWHPDRGVEVHERA